MIQKGRYLITIYSCWQYSTTGHITGIATHPAALPFAIRKKLNINKHNAVLYSILLWYSAKLWQ